MSWLLFEIKEVFIFLSLILRIYAIVNWFRLDYLQIVEKIINVKTSTLRAIIKVFDIIVYSNTLINNQRYTYSKRFYQMILKTRKTYQNLIKYVMSTNQTTFENVLSTFNDINETNSLKKNFFENDDNNDEKDFLKHDKFFVANYKILKINVMNEMLFVVVNFDFVFELDFAFVISRSQLLFTTSKMKTKNKNKRDRKSKINKFAIFFAFSNVYINFHLINNAREFATIMNFNVFAKKMKHM